MFEIKTENVRIVILVYVDDLVILASTEYGVSLVKDKLRSLFNVTELEKVRHYVGAFVRKGSVILLNQAGYCRRVLERFRMDREKAAPTSMVDNIENLSEGARTGEAGQNSSIGFPDRELLGILLYLSTHFPPHITFAVNVLRPLLESPLRV